MSASTLYEIIGWVASALIVISLTQKSILKLRLFGLAGAVAMVVYSLLIGAIPIAAVNLIIIFIQLYFLRGLLTAKDDYFEVLRVRKESMYLHHFLDYHDEDIQQFHPGFAYEQSDDQITAFILRDLIPAGLFIAEVSADGSLHVKLDYVIAQYRDLKVGRYVYSRAGLVAGEACTRVWTESTTEMHTRYLGKMGFVPRSDDSNDNVFIKELDA